MKVLILGGGVGALKALALSRAGHRVSLAERTATLSNKQEASKNALSVAASLALSRVGHHVTAAERMAALFNGKETP